MGTVPLFRYMDTLNPNSPIDQNPIEGLKKELQKLKEMVATLEDRVLDGEESLRAICNIKCTKKENKS
jgi:hypothetical protein